MALLVFSDSIPISRKVAFTEFERLGGCAWSSLFMALELLPLLWITLFITLF